ncbi:MAG: ABC transporter ATP-binding protein [Propionibacteriaceae bacterium]|jgi:peptide/nickel transport system ATP-binding protein|nr:ABC transporter ATP-binding protein [Propionibacteriaceae bacterium]
MTATLTATAPDRRLAADPLPAPSPDQAAPLVAVRNLTVRFTGRRPVTAVKGLDLTIRPGQTVALVGESGSGKSVTARSLVGLAGEAAVVTADRFELAGRDARRLTERQWRALRGGGVGLVLQDALTALDPLRTVGQEITEVLKTHRLGRRRRHYADQVNELLTAVGVDDPAVRARQYAHQLSGGLRQRALIASGLAGEPDLLIVDEPTTALDVSVQAQIIDLLRQHQARGTALLVISHDLAVVSRLADHLIVMRDGRAVEQGPTLEVLRHPVHRYTKDLLAAVPSRASRSRRLSPDPPIFDYRATPSGRAGGADDAQRTSSPSSRRRHRHHTRLRPLATPTIGGSGLSHQRVDTRAAAELARPAPEAIPPAGTPVLAAREVTKYFSLPGGRGRRRAVAQVSLELFPGQKLGLVGQSGSGKSTLARILLGLIRPDAGRVEVQGQSWAAGDKASRARLRRQVQFISQNSAGSFDPRYTVAEIIGEPLRGVLPARQAADRVVRLLDVVGLRPEVLDVSPRLLSGGQAQRVAICRALALRPAVIICDEPVSALDVSIQAQVLDLLDELNRATGTALAFISHDLGVVHHLVDQVIVMNNGFVVEQGDVEAVFGDPRHPYTQSLVRAIPRLPAGAAHPSA